MSNKSADSNDESVPEMRVEQIGGTVQPEDVVVQAARGDYYDGFVGDAPVHELVEPVECTDEHRKNARACLAEEGLDWDFNVRQEAKKRALIEQLIRRGHWGPFEHPQITLAIANVSRACMAQVTRHRHASFDVQSQRYVDFSEKDAIIPQSLLEDEHFSRDEGKVDVDHEKRMRMIDTYEDVTNYAFEQYQEFVDDGIPKEDARFMLPTGTPVNMTVSMNARAIMHVLNIRSKGNAQWEVRRLSELVEREFREWMPNTAELFAEARPYKEAP